MKYILLILILSTFINASNMDLDADGKYDKVDLSYEEDDGELIVKASIHLSSNSKIKRISIYPNNEEVKSNGYGLGLEEGLPGQLIINEHCCGIDKRYYLNYYLYNKEAKDWIFYKTLFVNNIFKKDKYGFRYFTDEHIIISFKTNSKGLISNKKHSNNFIKKYDENDINNELNRLINEFKTESRDTIDFFKIYNLISVSSINLKNITKYNDIAYYLEKTNAYKESIYLLEKILEKYPKRIVAYLNIADAYWGDKNKNKAIKNYKLYLSQMKKNGKEKKIPKKVFQRISNNKILCKVNF